LEIIQKISIQTFTETFAAVNTPENIDNYIKDSLNTERLTAELNNLNSQFYIAYSNDDVVGYLKINFGDAQTESFNENALEVQRIYVLQNFHGKNIGQVLLVLILCGWEFGKKIIEQFDFIPKMDLLSLTNTFLSWEMMSKPIY
jgi:GNAT superfamily N-acetyltransferase